jgi:hypothetical protein
LSQDWRQPLPQVTRALIIVHGRLRNAQTYLQSGVEAAELAGLGSTTLVIAPQFLNETDVKRNHLAERLLRWNGNDWMAGAPSTGPGQISSYTALDQIIEHLGNRQQLPGLKQIVVAGHSGGARWCSDSRSRPRSPDPRTAGVQVRYVIANPSSYAYFDERAQWRSAAPAARTSIAGSTG